MASGNEAEVLQLSLRLIYSVGSKVSEEREWGGEVELEGSILRSS